MKLKKSQPESADAGAAEVGTSGPNKLLLVGGGVVVVAAAGALAFVLLSGGDDPVDAAAPVPSPSATTPSASEPATPSTSASIPTYAAKNARDPFKALVTEPNGGGAKGGSSGTAPTTAPGSSGGGGGGSVITLPGTTVTVTQTISPTTSPTSAPTGSPTGTPTSTGTPSPSTSTTTIALPHGTQLVYIQDIVKGADGKPQSVTVYVDNKPYKGLTPQRDVASDKQETFGTYYMLLGLSDTTATIQYGDGSIFTVSLGEYHYVTS